MNLKHCLMCCDPEGCIRECRKQVGSIQDVGSGHLIFHIKFVMWQVFPLSFPAGSVLSS